MKFVFYDFHEKLPFFFVVDAEEKEKYLFDCFGDIVYSTDDPEGDILEFDQKVIGEKFYITSVKVKDGYSLERIESVIPDTKVNCARGTKFRPGQILVSRDLSFAFLFKTNNILVVDPIEYLFSGNVCPLPIDKNTISKFSWCSVPGVNYRRVNIVPCQLCTQSCFLERLLYGNKKKKTIFYKNYNYTRIDVDDKTFVVQEVMNVPERIFYVNNGTLLEIPHSPNKNSYKDLDGKHGKIFSDSELVEVIKELL